MVGCQRVLEQVAPDCDPSALAHLPLTPDLSAAKKARRWVLDQLTLEPDRAQDVALLVSELVTNAVLHARTRLVVGVVQVEDLVLITVEDRDLVMPQQQPYSRTRTNGRGIALLETLSERWGVERDESGKTVWCVVRTTGGRA